MRLFFYKSIIVIILFVLVNGLILIAIPVDRNSLSYAYNDKLSILQRTPSPKIVFVGGSNVANGVNSKMIRDSLYYNVVNFGLHMGSGIKYPLEDCLSYVKNGDVLVIQCEYGLFYKGWEGNGSNLAHLLISVKKRNLSNLSITQWVDVISGVPRVSIGYLMRLMKYPSLKSFNTPSSRSGEYHFVRDGFNEYGDEVAHLEYPNKSIVVPKTIKYGIIDQSFLLWLQDILCKFQDKGVQVFMVPPVIVSSYFDAQYNNKIGESLKEISHPYVVPPSYMVLDDCRYFDSGYHVDKIGVKQNTDHLIAILKRTNSN